MQSGRQRWGEAVALRRATTPDQFNSSSKAAARLAALRHFLMSNRSEEDHFEDDEVERELMFEEGFGWFFLIVGIVASLTNLFTILAISKHLKSRNVLFMIILNFAVIDEFKSVCAIYMGSVMVSAVHKGDQPGYHGGIEPYFLIIKMLQTSVFMFNIGNITSVFNLVLATVNEFLFMKLPFQYRKLITRWKVGLAIGLTWVLSIVFSFSKAFHNSRSSTFGTSNIWVSNNFSSTNISRGGTDARRRCSPICLPTETDDDQSNLTLPVRNMAVLAVFRHRDDYNNDVFTLVLMSCLLACLLIVMGTYISLYFLVRQSNQSNIRRGSWAQGSFVSNHSSLVEDNKSTGDIKIAHLAKLRRTLTPIPKSSSLFDSTPAMTAPKHNVSFAGDTNNHVSLKRLKSASGNSDVMANSLNSNRIFKRYKGVVVIMTVCGLYTIYLSIYFSLQLLHMQYITEGIQPDKLRQRYLLNFVLRSVYFLQAGMNPLLFLRIRSFRLSFMKLLRSLYRPSCCWSRHRWNSNASSYTGELQRKNTANSTLIRNWENGEIVNPDENTFL